MKARVSQWLAFRCLLASAALIAVPLPGLAQEAPEPDFAVWLAELRAEAAALGIGDTALQALDDLQAPLPRVLELDNSQPEFVQTFTRYLQRRVTPSQIARGRALLNQHAALLAEVRQRHGVQPHYIVSFWAIESNFGRHTGGFPVLQSLATLAFDPRRAEFFRRELITALRIIDAGHILPERMNGSWAGAMGQLQFLPSVFFRYGMDGDGDGRIDIWNSLPDIFHSAGNFLRQSGWQAGERWGREVLLPAQFDYELATGTRLTVTEWGERGLRRVTGESLPASEMLAAVTLPAGAAGPAFLTYANYRATLRYNPSTFYALTVGHLADRFIGGEPLRRMPANEVAMSVDEVRAMQERLNELGFDSGEPDGRMGLRTRAAVRAFQRARGLVADGYPAPATLAALAGEGGGAP